MTAVRCAHADDAGFCHGLYDGFGCIGDKCRDPTAGPPKDRCMYMRGDGYCNRFKKFHCLHENCIDYVPC